MSLSIYLRSHLRQCAVPVVGLCFGYWLMIDRPLSTTLAEQTAKHRQLISTTASGDKNAESANLALAASLRIECSLQEELKSLQQRGVQLVAQRADKQSQLLPVSSSPSAMSRMFELFQAHHLECLDSKVVGKAVVTDSKNPSADAPDFLKSMAELLGDGKPEKMKQREIRVTLRGRFEDIRSALREMQVALACVYVVSLEMEPEIDGLHIWKLVLLV